MEYKLAQIKDTKGIAELLQSRYGRYYIPFEFTSEVVKERLERKDTFYMIAIEEKKIVGVVRATIADFDLAELRHEVFPNKEIGKGLIEKALDFLEKKKMRKIVARTVAKDKLENELYKGLGWTQEGYFKEHYRKGTDIIQYAKFL